MIFNFLKINLIKNKRYLKLLYIFYNLFKIWISIYVFIFLNKYFYVGIRILGRLSKNYIFLN